MSHSAMLVRVLYTSRIASGVAAADIDRLVASAQRRNRQLDLTGALLVCDGRFVQVLEGRETAVDEMVGKIAADQRHHDMVMLDRLATPKRLFASWHLAFVDRSRCEVHLQKLLQQRETPADFVLNMVAWTDELGSGLG